MLGLALVSFVIMFSLLGLVWTPYDPGAMNLTLRLASFSHLHLLGTDHFGRDMFSMLLSGLGRSLLIAGVAIGAGALAGGLLGFASALSRHSFFDRLASHITDFIFVFPALLTAILLATLYGPSMFNAIIAIALFNIPVFFRLSRMLGLSLLARDYLRAARAMGQTPLGLLRRHLLPGSAGVLVTQLSIQLAMALLAEAALSYLGLGVPPPLASLGRMLQDAQTYMTSAPRLALIPGGMIALTVLSFNLLGDGLRDLIDTRHRQSFC